MATVAGNLRITAHFRQDEHEEVEQVLGQRLDRRLSRFDDDRVELEISLKDRDTPQQQVTLETWIAASGRTRFVGTSNEPDVVRAVREAGSDVRRQVDRYLTKREDARRG